jgi:hypothetical protein
MKKASRQKKPKKHEKICKLKENLIMRQTLVIRFVKFAFVPVFRRADMLSCVPINAPKKHQQTCLQAES